MIYDNFYKFVNNFYILYHKQKQMENQSLKKRLYQNLSQRPLKHTFLLESQIKDPKSPKGILKPRILQDSIIGEIKCMNNSGLASNSPTLLKTVQPIDKKIKPKKVQAEKLSKQAKSLIEQTKSKTKSNLKPLQIFAFYDAFPEMIQDFFYLNRVSHPYDYQIVSYAKRNHQQYMTISSQGVTLYHDKEAQFLTREQWLEDEKIYHKLQKICFFNQYKLSKNFMNWKNKMKSHYKKSMQNILYQKLFLIYSFPRKCLLQVRSLSIDLEQHLTLLPTGQIQTPAWSQMQKSTNHYLTHTLIAKIKQHQQEIIKSLEFAIGLEIKNFKQSNKIKIDGLNQGNEDNKQGYIYSQQAILRKQYKRVLKLIKLAESILLQSKINLVQRWLTDIYEKLKEVNEKNFRDEWLTINFTAIPPSNGQSQIKWNPSYHEFINTFKIMIDQAVQVICKDHQKIMNNASFQKYHSNDDQLQTKDDKNSNLQVLITNSKAYQELTQLIQSSLEQEYDHVVAQQAELKKYIEIYVRHKSMPPLEQIIKESSVQKIAIYAYQWKQDNKQMQDLPDKWIGMIKFDYGLIRKQMMSVAEISYMKLFSLLPVHLSQMCQQTSMKAKKMMEPIGVPYTIQKFVQFTKAVKQASDEFENIINQGKQIKRLQILLIENRCPNLDVQKNNIRTLEKLNADLGKAINEAETMQNVRLNQFKQKLLQKATIINTKAKQFSQKLQKIQMSQKSQNHNNIILKISQILPEIAKLDEQAININNTEAELTLTETNFNETHSLFNRTKVICSLWNQKKLWIQFNQEILKKHYWELDCEKETKRWEEFNKEIQNIKKFLESNQFLQDLANQVNKMQNQIQLVTALQSKDLSKKQWAEISEYLMFEFDRNSENQKVQKIIEPFKNPRNEQYKMEWLRKNKIFLYKQKISLIVKKSETESHLTNVHLILKTYIQTLNFKTVTKKRDIVLLGDNSVVFEELAEHLAALINIFNQEYSDTLKRQIKSLVKYYEYVIQILQSYRDFGQNWEKYQELFNPQRHYSKQLGKQSKQFGNLETLWKKIIKNIIMDGWSKKMQNQIDGANPNRNTMKAIYKANMCWQQIKKGIQYFLDQRRSIFSHYLYFSDNELLALLTKPESELSINSIIPLIYDNIKHIKLEKQKDSEVLTLVSVTSSPGEQLRIGKSIIGSKINSEFQDILKTCEQQWKKVLISNIRRTYQKFMKTTEQEYPKKKIIAQNITQVVLAFDNIAWVKSAQNQYLAESNREGSLQIWISIQNDQIQELLQIIKQGLDELEYKKMSQILLQLIYLRGKTQHFHKIQLQSLHSYQWERTLKLYEQILNTHQKITLKAFGSSIYYGGQFLGPSNLLYLAPQTERSYLNLAKAVNDRQTSLISGSSGQVETIKSFSSFLAQNFRKFVFCSGINNSMIDRVLAGICSQGVWAMLSLPDSWQVISFLASHLQAIQKSIRDNVTSIQLSKYTFSVSQSSLPYFMLKVGQKQLEHLQKVPKSNYRSLAIVTPSTEALIASHFLNSQNGQIIGEVIQELNNYCKDLFSESVYHQFQIDFVRKVTKQLKLNGKQSGDYLRKKIMDTFVKVLSPKLKLADQQLLQSLVQSLILDPDQRLKIKKSPTMDVSMNCKIASLDETFNDFNTRNTQNLSDAIQESWQTGKNVVLVGPAFSGKTTLIDNVKNSLETSTDRKINLTKVYFNAHRETDLLSTPSIISKCIQQKSENWIVLDGPVNKKYLNTFSKITDQVALANHGVIKNRKNIHKMKLLLETTDLSSVSPDFVTNHFIVYLESGLNRASEIVKSRLSNFEYRYHEEVTRQQVRSENSQFQVKTYRIKSKPMGLSKQSIEYLISHITALIEKVAPRDIVKIKSVQLLYELSACELAYRTVCLTEAVFVENWDSIKQKLSKKMLQKFAVWVVMWSMCGIVNPQDYQKLQKAICQLTKSNICQGILSSIVYPGNGIQIFSLNSQKNQNVVSTLPNFGDIINIVNKYNGLNDFQTTASVKNKFEQGFYEDEPNRIRVITNQSIIFSFFGILNKNMKMPMVLYGPPSSGKKSILQIFNKKHEESIESYSIRFKKHDPYYLSNQLQKPFIKYSALGKTILKPHNISKRMHISIDDVSMVPSCEPASEILRMVANSNSIFDDKFNCFEFRQLILSLTVNQIQFCNQEGIDFKRVLSRMMILQTARPSKEKICSIFAPILQNLCMQLFFGQNSELSQNFTNKNGQNIIVNSTVNIYSFVQQMVKQHPSNSIFNLNKKLILTPRISEVCNVLTNICRNQQLQKDIQYYVQFWAHQVLRVFSDKLNNSEQQDALFQEIKKYSFMEFKHSIINSRSSFLFTNLLKRKQDQESKFSFSKLQDLAEIQKQIDEIYEKEALPISAPFVTEQFILQLMRFYRVLAIKSGSLLLATPFRKSAKFLVKIATFLAQNTVYHDIQHGVIDFNSHIAPSILKQFDSCLIVDAETMTDQTLYQLTCLANRNVCEFEINSQVRSKIIAKLVAKVQDGLTKQSQLAQPISPSLGLKNKSSLNSYQSDTAKQAQIQNRIQLQFSQLISECFSEYMHIVCCVNPASTKSTKFLNQNMSLIKTMQVCWHQLKNQTLYLVGEKMMDQLYQNKADNKKILQNCHVIYEMITDEQKSDADFLKLLGSCSKVYETVLQKIDRQSKQCQECIQVLNKNVTQAKQLQEKLKQLQDKISELNGIQQSLGTKIKILQENGGEGLQALENQMKKIKSQRQNLDIQSRECRGFQKICQNFNKSIPKHEVLQSKIDSITKTRAQIIQNTILVQSALMYLNNSNQTQYLNTFNSWRKALGLAPLQSIGQIVSIFETMYSTEYIRVPGWQRFSEFTQLKGFHFCQNFSSIPQSVFGEQPIIVDDSQQILVSLLTKISHKNPSINIYSNLKLISYVRPAEQPNEILTRKQTFAEVEREIEKAMNQISSQLRENTRQDDKQQLRKGIIIIGSNHIYEPNRNDIQVFERRILQAKRIITENRIIALGKISPNITFHPDSNDLKQILQQKSMLIEYGESLVVENNKNSTFLRELAIREERRIQELIKTCISKQSEEKILQIIEKVQNQLTEIQKIRKRLTNSSPQDRKSATDEFFIDWIVSLHEFSDYKRVLQIYQFLKKCLMELNMGRQVRINAVDQIECLQNWQMLLKSNLTNNGPSDLLDLVKFLMPVQDKLNLILIQQSVDIETKVKNIIKNCPYTVHYVDLHLNATPDYILPEQEVKGLWVLANFCAEISQHASTLLDHIDRNKSSCCPVIIIITDNITAVKNNKKIQQKFRILQKQIQVDSNKSQYEVQMFNMEVQQQNLKKTTISIHDASKSNRKWTNQNESAEQNLQQQNDDKEQQIIYQIIKKFLVIYVAHKNNIPKNILNEIPVKAILSRVKLIRKVTDISTYLKQHIHSLSQNWINLLNDIISSEFKMLKSSAKANEIQLLFNNSLQKQKQKQSLKQEIQNIANKNEEQNKIKNDYLSTVEQILSQLPFAFNCQDFAQTAEPFALWMIDRATKINKKRSFLKKYLLDCIEVVKGNKIAFWTGRNSNNIWLPSKQQIVKLNSDYKIIRRGLQMAGLITSIDNSSKDIKLSNGGLSNTQVTLSLACQSFDCRSLQGFSAKLILLLLIKASRKLKLPLHKLKVAWRVVGSDITVQQPVNSENCLALTAKISNPQFLKNIKSLQTKQPNTIKLLLMIYDPTPIAPAVPVPVKHQKQEQAKIVNVQSSVTYAQIPIYLTEGKGKQIGVLPVVVKEKDEQNGGYNFAVQETCISLY